MCKGAGGRTTSYTTIFGGEREVKFYLWTLFLVLTWCKKCQFQQLRNTDTLQKTNWKNTYTEWQIGTRCQGSTQNLHHEIQFPCWNLQLYVWAFLQSVRKGDGELWVTRFTVRREPNWPSPEVQTSAMQHTRTARPSSAGQGIHLWTRIQGLARAPTPLRSSLGRVWVMRHHPEGGPLQCAVGAEAQWSGPPLHTFLHSRP